jgi:hypothetical protein
MVMTGIESMAISYPGLVLFEIVVVSVLELAETSTEFSRKME